MSGLSCPTAEVIVEDPCGRRNRSARDPLPKSVNDPAQQALARCGARHTRCVAIATASNQTSAGYHRGSVTGQDGRNRLVSGWWILAVTVWQSVDTGLFLTIAPPKHA